MYAEIDIYDLLTLLRRKFTLILFSAFVAALLSFAYSLVFMQDVYTAKASMYILLKDDNVDSVTSSVINASQMLVNDISDLAFTSRVQEDTLKSLNISSLNDYSINIHGGADSRVLTLSVTGIEPHTTSSIANSLVDNINKVATEVMNIESINVIDEAQEPLNPSGPNRLKVTLTGFMLGAFFSVGFVIFSAYVNPRINTFHPVYELLDLPIVAHVPRFNLL